MDMRERVEQNAFRKNKVLSMRGTKLVSRECQAGILCASVFNDLPDGP